MKSINRMMSLLQITPITIMMERETMRSVYNLIRVTDDEPEEEHERSPKVGLHARRTLWMLRRPSAPTQLCNARMVGRSKSEWEERLVGYWNTRPPDEVLRSRPLPKARIGEEPGVWRAKTVTGEQRSVILKFLVDKFPIPQGN